MASIEKSKYSGRILARIINRNIKDSFKSALFPTGLPCTTAVFVAAALSAVLFLWHPGGGGCQEEMRMCCEE